MADASEHNLSHLKTDEMESTKAKQAHQHSPTSASAQPRAKRPKLDVGIEQSAPTDAAGLQSTSDAQTVGADGDDASDESNGDEDGSEEDEDDYDLDDEDEEEPGGREVDDAALRELYRMLGMPAFGNDDSEGEEEDEEARDYEVEESDYTIQGTPARVLKLRIAICKEIEGPFEKWLENIHVRCTLDGKVIATAFGRYIRRGAMAANFWRDMEEPSHDMSELAFELFDRYGYLNAKFKDHCIQRGTGVWGAEMDNGPLFLIERTIVTDRDLRGKGIGRAMISLMIQKAQTREKPQTGEQIQMSKIFYGEEDLSKYSTLHAVVVPGWLRSDVEPLAKGVSRAEKRKIYNQACDDAVAFYRTFGFRRIGASSCFGYSFDPAHKSRAIEASADYDPPEPPEEDLSEDEGANPFDDSKQQKKMDRLRDKLPLHHATLTLPDKECVAFYKGFLDHSGIEWKQSDRLENNVLHVAACQQKPESVKWIMENANTGTVLSSSRNIHGYTPLEALQDVLEIGRTRKEVRMLTLVVADQFEGFNTDAVDCLSLLTGLDPRTMSKIQRQRLKFGCTCGECLDGFMSPRMCAALLFQAETTCDMLDMDIGNGPDWCMSNDYMFTYVAPDLRQNFRTNKSYREGFKNIFGFMAECLRAKMLPVRDNVLLQWENESEWPPVTRNYLQRGGTLEGKIEPALRICFDHAQEQGEKTGDGEYERVMKNEVPLLKKCRNDDEFRFVAVQCGLPAQEYY